jgi:hypothetical protein
VNLRATYERAYTTPAFGGRVKVVLQLRDGKGERVELVLDMAAHCHEDFCFDISRTKPLVLSHRRVTDEPEEAYEATLRDA